VRRHLTQADYFQHAVVSFLHHLTASSSSCDFRDHSNLKLPRLVISREIATVTYHGNALFSRTL